jgi:hypothetical protein
LLTEIVAEVCPPDQEYCEKGEEVLSTVLAPWQMEELPLMVTTGFGKTLTETEVEDGQKPAAVGVTE